jgi:hypothetical protein
MGFSDHDVENARFLFVAVADKNGCHPYSPIGPYYSQEATDERIPYLTRAFYQCSWGIETLFFRLLESKDGARLEFLVQRQTGSDETGTARALNAEIKQRVLATFAGCRISVRRSGREQLVLNGCKGDLAEPH